MANEENFRAELLHQIHEIRANQQQTSERLIRMETRIEGFPEQFSSLRSQVADHSRYIEQQRGGTKALIAIASAISTVAGAVGGWLSARIPHP